MPTIDKRELQEIAKSAATRTIQSTADEEAARGTGLLGALGRFKDPILMATAAGFLGLAILNLVGEPKTSTVKHVTEDALQLMSPHLASGYRDQMGKGPTFIGTLKPSWAALSAVEQVEVASEVVDILFLYGAREVMLFDEVRRLQVQGAGGRLRMPKLAAP